MKKITVFATAAMLVVGTKLHAQAPAKQDTTHKAVKTAMTHTAKPAGTTVAPKTEAKVAKTAKTPADSTHKKAKRSGKKSAAKKDTTAKKP
jgi:hypothetical protein